MSLTNSDGLDLDSILDVGSTGVLGVEVVEYRLAAEGVDKGSTSCL